MFEIKVATRDWHDSEGLVDISGECVQIGEVLGEVGKIHVRTGVVVRRLQEPAVVGVLEFQFECLPTK